MSRPIAMVGLLLLVVFTSQLEWRQQIVNEVEASPRVPHNKRFVSEREESVKEKIILSQEKKIQKLNELVLSLREQLLKCKTKNEVVNDTATPFTELLHELEQQQILKD